MLKYVSSVTMLRKIFTTAVCLLFSQFLFSQKKITLYDDTAQMRREILSKIPAGTDIETAKMIMKKNHFDIEDMKIDSPLYRQEFVKEPFDYIFCRRDKNGFFSFIEKSWAVAILYKNNKVIDVKNELWLTGL